MKDNQLFYQYFADWIQLFKVDAISEETLSKYWLTYRHLRQIAPNLQLADISRSEYQKILNKYAKYHERSTTLDFHHHLKAALLDAFDENLISKDPTRKIVIKGRLPRAKKAKFLSEFELKILLEHLNLQATVNFDWLILLIAKTGLRLSEALGLTKADFDFKNHTLTVNKTWNYKQAQGGFRPTKNKSSIRKISLDKKLTIQFKQLLQPFPADKAFFVEKRVFNSTINNRLKRYCQELDIPVISIHGLRHTHASLLLFAGVSVASVASRLGHSNMTTTQQTYLHIIQELETKDTEKIVNHLANL